MSKPYTVQCGYYGHSGNVVEVRADTPEEACQKAIEAVNGDEADGWKMSDACTDTYVDAICEGDEAHLWSDKNPLRVPDEFKEATEQLGAALMSAVKSLMAERDCLYDSVAKPGTGEIDDDDDRRMVEEADAEIDRYRDVLRRCGYGMALDGQTPTQESA